jgi:hypothetical protein
MRGEMAPVGKFCSKSGGTRQWKCHLCWTTYMHISSFPSQNSSSLTKFGQLISDDTILTIRHTQPFASSHTYTARRCPEVPSAGAGHWSRDLQGPVAAVRCPYLEHALATRKGGQSLPVGPVAALLGASSWQWEWPEMQSASSSRPTSRAQEKPHSNACYHHDTNNANVQISLRANERQLTASRAWTR